MSSPATLDEGTSAARRAGIGALVALGWASFEAALFTTSGDPHAVLELLPAWTGIVLATALLGAATRWLRWLPLASAFVCGAIAVGQRLHWLHTPASTGHLCQALCLLALGFQGALLLRRVASGPLRHAFVLGCLASAGFAWLHLNRRPQHTVFLLLAVALVALGFVRRKSWRFAATAIAVLVAAAPLVQRAVQAVRIERPDLGAPETRAAPGRPSVVLLVMDTVRADRLSCYGYERTTTPGLDAFAREHATRYERARSTASWTLPAHATMFTGLQPGEHGADHPRGAGVEGMRIGTIRPACRLRPDVPTLAEVLRAAGYRTGAVVANEAYLDHRFGIDRGFEHYDDRGGSYVEGFKALPQLLGFGLRVGHFVYRDAPRVLGAAREWLDSLPEEEPFFLVVNFMDAHLPVVPPPPFDRAFSPQMPRDPIAPTRAESSLQYDRGLAFLDREIAGFFDWLARTDRFDDAVVIVTADHGEAFGEHRGFFSHAWLLYEELVHVPLLVKPAGPREKAVESRPFGLTEVMALVLRLTGLSDADAPAAPLASEWYRAVSNPDIDRWAAEAGHDVTSDYLSWLEGDRKYIVSSGGRVECYDLAADPGEQHALELEPTELARVLDHAHSWWEAHPPVLESQPAEAPGGEELERMKALGYAGENEPQK